MATKTTTIEWCDHTFNPWSGCTKVSEGCKNCYAEVNYSVKMRGVKWGPSGNRIVAAESGWKKPLAWERQSILGQAAFDANGDRHRPRVFCASLADVFEDWQGPMLDHLGASGTTGTGIPIRLVHNESNAGPPWLPSTAGRSVTMQDVRNRLFKLIDATPNLDWLLLTKRPENIRKMWVPTKHGGRCASFPDCTHPDCIAGRYRPNVWLLTSVEDQPNADKRIPELLKCRDLVPVLGLSVEPLLGPIDLRAVPYQDGNCLFVGPMGGHEYAGSPRNFLNWCIVGGESGHESRPCSVEWIRSIVGQCKAAGVACFVKQLGNKPGQRKTIDDVINLGYGYGPKPLKLLDSKGGDMDEWPEDLRIREFPRAQ